MLALLLPFLLVAIVVVYALADTIRSMAQLTVALLRPYLRPNEALPLRERFGQWALVTGATDGVGLAYSKELAKRGISVVLVSRSSERLAKAAQDIEQDFNVKTRCIAADFSTGQAAIDKVEKELGNLPIGILVNNVGKQYEFPAYLTEVPKKDLWDIININVGATTLMTQLLLPQMVQRKSGAIVNVSSGSELQPLPLMTVYAATKSYVKNFTMALRMEYSQHNITVHHLSPYFISTKMNDFSKTLRKTNIFIPDAATYAKHAIRLLGKQDHSTGYWSHGIQYFFTSLAPEWLRIHIANFLGSRLRAEYFNTVKR